MIQLVAIQTSPFTNVLTRYLSKVLSTTVKKFTKYDVFAYYTDPIFAVKFLNQSDAIVTEPVFAMIF
jgi:hypothetical protein